MDEMYDGNLKRVVRLLKNMVADMPESKKQIVKNLSSYDLAAIGYHMEQQLNLPTYMPLGLVEKTRAHLNLLKAAPSYRDTLLVPDASRRIFDSSKKVKALEILENEMNYLALSIFNGIAPYARQYDANILTNKAVFL